MIDPVGRPEWPTPTITPEAYDGSMAPTLRASEREDLSSLASLVTERSLYARGNRAATGNATPAFGPDYSEIEGTDASPIHTVCRLQNSLIPWADSSLP